MYWFSHRAVAVPCNVPGSLPPINDTQSFQIVPDKVNANYLNLMIPTVGAS